jgi:hypothetical protein
VRGPGGLAGPAGPARWKVGLMACGPGNEKEKRKINSKLISEFKKFRKMNKDILVVEIIGKISPK